MLTIKILCGFILTVSEVLSVEIFLNIPNGQIKGRQEVSARNQTFYAFQQIPYGKPPIGKLRFRDPEPVDDWEGVFDATVNDKVCYQITSTSPLQTEDCLYVNVYTPVVNTVIPGNYGLKDQILGLKWVKNNIKYFGGDPDKVTIFGLSAGAASVTYLMMSKQSEGLYRGAIAESGSALTPWSYQRNHKEIAYKLASFIDSNFSPNATSEELLELLQNAPVNEINTLAGEFPEGVGHEELVQGYFFTPVIEPEHENAFLTERMYAVVENGVPNKVPLVIGICSEEQIGKAADLENFKIEMSQYDNDVALLVNDNMHLTDHESKTRAGEAIRKIYTDGLFVDDIGGAVRASTGRVYHTEDKYYLWSINNSSDLNSEDPKDILTSERYITLFTDFAKTLNPTPQPSSLTQNLTWPKVTPDNFQFLNIDTDLEIQTNPKGKAYKDWVEVYETFAVKPYDTF
ncbi:hypothetical protein NQ314_011711 [Rhamnusium bicolor]|uniref:Carboxylic ester hydrolase n=1 Tax=Rhamnusium bicolor TaxID=1586634 RepID=A0AAV8XGT6_9CUCU|nr:hypothetical protein NQ314_011711 [Rhamnusium bicolor]